MFLQGLTVFFTVIAISRGADIQWQARVLTTDTNGAGTDAGVHIQIIGESERKTANINLGSGGGKLEQAGTDTYLFNAQDVGAPTKLRVWHDNTGGTPGWHLNRIELTALHDEYPNTFYFMCECWLATDQLEHGIERTLAVATIDWEARITTSNVDGTNYDSEVWITISGDKGSTRQIYLDNPDKDDFERGETDVFMLKAVDIGTPTKVRVHTVHDDPWHLDKIVLKNLNGAKTYTFDCDCWLGKAGKTIKEIPLFVEDDSS